MRSPRTMRNGRAEWLLENNDDRYTSQNLYIYPRFEGESVDLRTFLFTDRAIYRPGQEMHVKGIVTTRRGKNAEIVTGYRARVFFHDVNGDVIDSLIATTDAYGAFHGTFTTPVGRLTGLMHLHEEHGDKWIRVEEYKRPTFEARFEPISATPTLGDEAMVVGTALSYAGAPLDGASVRYTVRRSARMPWWCGWQWRGLGWWRQTEVASGEATCDAQGRFIVRFKAEASRAFPRAADPSFAFDVEAWVTDINGETQSASTSFVVGYRSIEPLLGVEDAVDRSMADSLLARIDNLNGQRVDIPFDLRITRLLRPEGRVKRTRLWERPDQQVLTDEEFAQRFPDDERTDMDDPVNWARGAVVLDQHGLSPEGKQVALAGVRDWEVGTYIAELDVVDPGGQPVRVSRTFTLFDPDIQHTGFENEAFHVEVLNAQCEPGEKAVLLLSSALPACRVLMEVERDGAIVVSRPFTLRNGQQRVELPVLEGDRGGFAVHFVCVERGRDHNSTQWIDVPWSNKELKVEWMSFRDKLLPGAREEWRLRITGPKKEKVTAQLLAAMYDASLDVFETPDWSMPIHGSNNALHAWAHSEPFGIGGGYHNYVQRYAIADSARRYPLLVGELPQRRMRRRFRTTAAPPTDGRMDMAGDAAEMEATRSFSLAAGLTDGSLQEEDEADKNGGERTEAATQATSPGSASLRTDFRETAFFFPDLLTDRDGEVVLRFTMPDALTRWNFMGFAHTKELQLAHIARSTITQKPLMVIPNLPRFLRQGDRITLTAKINKVEEGAASGTARLELFDPRTNAAITSRFIAARTERAFTAAPGSSANVSWALQVPEGVDAVAVRITASGIGFSDGEERVLPILTDKVLVTESVPMAITKAGTKTFELPNLLNAADSPTIEHRSLTLEYTPNPAWYAVQALPYMMEFPHECAEQVFSRYYANRLATHIVRQRPAVKRVFEAWSKGAPGNEGAFLSALEKNPELRSVLLEETPWVMNAKDESERKRRIALFFDLHRMANEEAMSLKKLGDMQRPNGAWPWWSGMQPSRYITQHIVAGFGHLQKLGALDDDPDTDARRMVKSAVEWLDKQADEDYRRMLRDFKGDSIPHPSAEDIHYLYARTCFPQYPFDRRRDGLAEFIITRAERYWLHYGLQEQAMIAIALHRLGNQDVPALIMESLSQRATLSEELGMYWKGFHVGYYWYEFPTETHALMIEAFDLVTKDKQKVNALRQYLLKLKQTTDWRTTKATADACYALLLTGDDWLEARNAPAISVGGERVRPQAQEAGTGYFTKAWQGNEVKPAMGRVSVTSTDDALQWGALHWQYFERMDKVMPHESPFSLRRQVMLNERTDAGARLIPLDSARALKAGDKLTVRVELRTDRYLDYVHLKDLRAAGLEPVATISGYQWKGGLGYYQSIRDAAMNFFFDRIPPGTYVFEYDLKATHTGVFSNGITSAQCMYAPEFSSHSAGLVITIGQP
ncbi:MAG: hypothetical protein IPL52_07425 [Flavobacteriales bacterium]|nr:hypothetical protein [Flavobacteriales bacterium]